MGTIISFGDSFTWGTDLGDMHAMSHEPLGYEILESPINTDGIYDTFGDVMWGLHWKPDYSKSTWPSLLADDLSMGYVCHASPGASNHTIYRSILDNLQSLNEGDLVVVNWTWIDRWDVLNCIDNSWVTLRPSDEDSHLHKFYLKYLQSELWNKLETLKNITSIINILENLGINFVMTCLDKLILDKEFHAPQYILELQDIVTPSLIWFDDNGFYDWSKNNNFPMGETGHPLEESHSEAFKYIKKNYEFTK
jgi:hypothetical protein